jgi:hypothetical protein
MRDKLGRFKKGERASPETEFKPGQHWREPKLYWDRDWLYAEYIVKQRSAQEIADDFGCIANNIFYFLDKHQIPRRTIKEARAIKHWGLSGPDNGMYGLTGEKSPNWKGGRTPERQAFYSSREWAEACITVWKRDQATCQRCNKKQGKNATFHIHHIAPFKVVELRAELTNLILLCRECHSWVHGKKNVNKELINDDD